MLGTRARRRGKFRGNGSEKKEAGKKTRFREEVCRNKQKTEETNFWGTTRGDGKKSNKHWEGEAVQKDGARCSSRSSQETDRQAWKRGISRRKRGKGKKSLAKGACSANCKAGS